MNRITKLRSELVTQHPLFGLLAYSLKYIEDTKIETACTDGIEIRYNPKFFQKLLDVEAKAVLAHEILHVALLHHTRRNNRDIELWNIAADYVINLILTDYNFKLPKDCLLDQKYQGMSTEKVYTFLKTQPKIKIYSPLGSVTDCPTELNNEEKIKEIIEETVGAAKGRGESPGSFDTRVLTDNRPQIHYADRIREYFQKSKEIGTSYETFDEAYATYGIFLPGYSGKTGNVCLILDTSGSTGPFLTQFLETANALREELQIKKMSLIQADSVVQWTEEDWQGEHVRIRGGGGTAFQPALDRVEEFDPDIAVYLSDLCGPVPLAPAYPLLWVNCSAFGGTKENFPGEVVQMELI